jgi:cytochrome oxidase Cu insertion factor (SCO1/SenC/PrrC family)
MSTVNAAPARRNRSRLSLLLLISIFAAPVALAWLAFFVFPEWQPSGRSNHGELIEPVRSLPAFRLQTLDGDSFDEEALKGKWTLVYLARGSCSDDCVQQLYTLRQVRLAQGKNIERVQRLMLWDTAKATGKHTRELVEHFPGLLIAPLGGDRQDLLAVFDLDDAPVLSAGRIYLVDPLGNLMMVYRSGDPPRGMIKDLEKLLKWSGLG